MVDMGEISPFRPDFKGRLMGLFKCEVGPMGLLSQCTDDENLHSPERFQALGRDEGSVRNIGKILLNAVGIDRHVGPQSMLDGQGHDVKAADVMVNVRLQNLWDYMGNARKRPL